MFAFLSIQITLCNFVLMFNPIKKLIIFICIFYEFLLMHAEIAKMEQAVEESARLPPETTLSFNPV